MKGTWLKGLGRAILWVALGLGGILLWIVPVAVAVWNFIVWWFSTFSWGTVPDWLAGIGTVGTVIYAVVSTRRERRRHLEAEDKENRRLAKLEDRQDRDFVAPISFQIFDNGTFYPQDWGKESPPLPPVQHYRVQIHNPSVAPIYDLELVHIATEREATDELPEFNRRTLVWNQEVIPADPEPVDVFLTSEQVGHDPRLLLWFTDTRGNRWSKTLRGELTKVLDLGTPIVHLSSGQAED